MLNALSAIAALLTVFVGGWAAYQARRSAIASERSAKAASDELVETKSQRESATNPVLALSLSESPSLLVWELGGRQPLPTASIEIVNFGGGPALELLIQYNLKAERSDLARAALHLSNALREHNVNVLIEKGFLIEKTLLEHGSQGYGVPVSLTAMSQTPYLSSHERVTVPVPDCLLRGILLTAVDLWTDRMNERPQVSEKGCATIEVRLECRSVTGVLLTFKKVIDLRLSLQARFSLADDTGWRFDSEKDPFRGGSSPILESFISWSSRREGPSVAAFDDKTVSTAFHMSTKQFDLSVVDKTEGASSSQDPPS